MPAYGVNMCMSSFQGHIYDQRDSEEGVLVSGMNSGYCVLRVKPYNNLLHICKILLYHCERFFIMHENKVRSCRSVVLIISYLIGQIEMTLLPTTSGQDSYLDPYLESFPSWSSSFLPLLCVWCMHTCYRKGVCFV